MLQLEQSRRDFELRLKEMEIDAQKSAEQVQRDSLDIARATRATMEGLRDIADKTDKFTTTWTKWAVRIAIAALLVVIAQYLFPDLGPQIGQRIDALLGFPFGTTAPR